MKILKEDFEDFEEEGLLAQLVESYTGIAEVMGSNPVRAWIFFRSYLQLLISVVFLAARIS